MYPNEGPAFFFLMQNFRTATAGIAQLSNQVMSLKLKQPVTFFEMLQENVGGEECQMQSIIHTEPG